MVNEASLRTPGALQSIVLAIADTIDQHYLYFVQVICYTFTYQWEHWVADSQPHNGLTIPSQFIALQSPFTQMAPDKYSYISAWWTQKHHQEMNIMNIHALLIFLLFRPFVNWWAQFSIWRGLSTCWCQPRVPGHRVINWDIVGNHAPPVKARCLWLEAGLLLSLVTKSVNTDPGVTNQQQEENITTPLSDVNREGDTWHMRQCVMSDKLKHHYNDPAPARHLHTPQ